MLNRCKQVRSFLFFFSFLLTLFFLWHDKKNMAADCRLGNGCGEMGLQETQQQQHTEREFHKWNVKHQKSNSRALYFSPPFDPRNWQKLFILLSEIWRSIVKGILNGQCTHGQRNVLLCNYREEFVSLYILLFLALLWLGRRMIAGSGIYEKRARLTILRAYEYVRCDVCSHRSSATYILVLFANSLHDMYWCVLAREMVARACVPAEDSHNWRPQFSDKQY